MGTQKTTLSSQSSTHHQPSSFSLPQSTSSSFNRPFRHQLSTSFCAVLFSWLLHCFHNTRTEQKDEAITLCITVCFVVGSDTQQEFWGINVYQLEFVISIQNNPVIVSSGAITRVRVTVLHQSYTSFYLCFGVWFPGGDLPLQGKAKTTRIVIRIGSESSWYSTTTRNPFPSLHT